MNRFASFSEQEAPLDLEHTESIRAGADEAMLYVVIVDSQLRPRAGLRIEIEGDGLRLSAVTDAQGILFLDDCPAGDYTISAGGLKAAVHTLLQSDTEQSVEPCLSLLQ